MPRVPFIMNLIDILPMSIKFITFLRPPSSSKIILKSVPVLAAVMITFVGELTEFKHLTNYNKVILNLLR